MLKSLLHRLLPSRPARRAAAAGGARAGAPATDGPAPAAETMPARLRHALELASGMALARARRRLIEPDDKRSPSP